MRAKDEITKWLEGKELVSGKEISKFLGISRQAVNKHLKELIERGRVVKEGHTKGTVYRLAGKRQSVGSAGRIQALQKFRKRYFLQGLEEHNVFREAELLLNLRKHLGGNVFRIVNYAFSEILNNAIEHSQSAKCDVEIQLGQYNCQFRIRDYGIGIFYSLFAEFNLLDENSAVGELVKGKRTTMKEKHSGEGVFFTSKSGDSVVFRSHKTALIFDNLKKDVFVSDKRFVTGTEVNFAISKHSKRKLDEIFGEYASEEFEHKFEKTRVFVKLFQKEYVSRSEAKRLLSGLSEFREIVLDFKGVKSMGQGFADEIFRVFRKVHPDIAIKTENLSAILQSMISHVVDNNI